jgi:hypothetical protein
MEDLVKKNSEVNSYRFQVLAAMIALSLTHMHEIDGWCDYASLGIHYDKNPWNIAIMKPKLTDFNVAESLWWDTALNYIYIVVWN